MAASPYNMGGLRKGCIHGNTFDSFDSWLINHDTYDNAKCADRWPREEPWFLKKVKIPVHEIAMTMSIALRFIPILIEETDKIMKAQTARGADFESGGFIKKPKRWCRFLYRFYLSISPCIRSCNGDGSKMLSWR